MKMKKTAFAVLGVAALTLSGCAGMGGSSGDDSASADGKTTIEFWSNHPGNSKPIEQEIIKEFEKANPDIKVKLVDAGQNYEEVAQKVNSALSGSQVPDLTVVSDVTWFNFALNDQLAPLDELLDKVNGDPKDYVPNLYDEYVYQDKHRAVPFARSTPLFYYNKDMWAKAGLPDRGPKTWDEWNKDFAPKLKKSLPSGVVPMIVPDGTNYLDWYFQGMAWSMGGAYSKDWTMTMTSPETIKAGEFLQNQFKDGYFKKVKEATAPFVAGQSAAILESTGSLSAVSKDGKIKVGTSFLPTPEGTPGCPTGGSGVAILEKSKHKEAAAKFLAFLTNAKNTVKFSQATGYMPVRTSAINLPEEQEYLKKDPNFKTAVDQLPLTKKQDAGRVFVSGGGMKIGAALDKVANGDDVKSTFEQVNKELQALIDKDIKPKLK